MFFFLFFFFSLNNFCPFKHFSSPFLFMTSPFFDIPPHFKEFFVSLPLCPYLGKSYPPPLTKGGTMVEWGRGKEHCFSSVKCDIVTIMLCAHKFCKHKAIIFLHEFIFVFLPCFIGPVLGKMEQRKNIVKKTVCCS